MSRPLFQQIYIEITNICNMHCPFCIDTIRKKEYMSFDNFKIIIDRIKQYTHSIYLHVKGEPLIHPKFKEFIKYLNDNSINTKITTNGTKLALYKDLILNNKNIHKINISLESIIHRTKEEQTKYFKELALFLKDTHSTHIYLRNWALSTDENKIILNYLKNIYPDAQFIDNELLAPYIHFSTHEKFEWPTIKNDIIENSTCLGGKNQLGILVDGTVVLCCLDNNGDTSLGNILESSLESILNSELYQRAVKKMPYFELCKRCTYRLKFKRKGGTV